MTTTLRVEFLSGRASLTLPDSDQAEWPPHPDRVFSALVAAHYECGVGDRAALLWLEQQPPPAIYAPQAIRRESLHYVPVNDPLKDQKLTNAPLPERHMRLPRHTNTLLLPESDRSVYYTWPAEAPPSLAPIVEAVHRVGHSSSFVAAALVDEAPRPNYLPTADGEPGEVHLRVPYRGRLDDLDEIEAGRRARSKAERERRSNLAPPPRWRAYRGQQEEPVATPRSLWRKMYCWSFDPRGPHVTSTLMVAERVRSALLSLAADPPPPALSGHGRPDHLAIVPLAFTGVPHADGYLRGFAVLLPELADDEHRNVLRALKGLDHLALGSQGRFRLRRVDASERRRTLHAATWRGPAATWASITPVLLDRYPRSASGVTPERLVADACRRIGLPAPGKVLFDRHAHLPGAEPSWRYRVRRGPQDRRPYGHAVLSFNRPVQGPITIGAGRHFGLGFFRPLEQDRGLR